MRTSASTRPVDCRGRQHLKMTAQPQYQGMILGLVGESSGFLPQRAEPATLRDAFLFRASTVFGDADAGHRPVLTHKQHRVVA